MMPVNLPMPVELPFIPTFTPKEDPILGRSLSPAIELTEDPEDKEKRLRHCRTCTCPSPPPPTLEQLAEKEYHNTLALIEKIVGYFRTRYAPLLPKGDKEPATDASELAQMFVRLLPIVRAIIEPKPDLAVELMLAIAQQVYGNMTFGAIGNGRTAQPYREMDKVLCRAIERRAEMLEAAGEDVKDINQFWQLLVKLEARRDYIWSYGLGKMYFRASISYLRDLLGMEAEEKWRVDPDHLDMEKSTSEIESRYSN
ncbi:hypothetical protein EJ06DRAFT_530976 [Trichodelitschia bisporula]|uniref:Uncharacterized protein n=1 Tax=Trichodelitschia bisporula TaxID=703511 RepID=A0A6G1HU34_9PEZI|nr:hypothetical protein EJ06DRAFT_530976 [Trichodelitschia bisporula]